MILEAIEERRKELGWSVYRLAKEMGLRVKQAQNIENGENVKLKTIEAAMKALGLTVSKDIRSIINEPRD